MKKAWVLLGLMMTAVVGCRDRMACPEYQSRYILDDDYREAFFAVFDEDTLPIYDAEKVPERTWYGIVEKKNWLERKHEIETVRMEKVFAPKEEVDTATFQSSDFVDTGDSTATTPPADTSTATPDPATAPVDISSTNTNADDRGPQYAIVSNVTDEDKTYNVEQSLYMYYVGEEVMRKREEAYNAWQKAEAERLEEQRIKDSTRFARKEKFLSFFRFKKKEEEVVEEEPYDPFRDEEPAAIPGDTAPSDSTQGQPTPDPGGAPDNR